MNKILATLAIILNVFLLACATVSDQIPFLGGEEAPARYSENPQMTAPTNRQYKKMTKNRMEEEAEIHSFKTSSLQKIEFYQLNKLK